MSLYNLKTPILKMKCERLLLNNNRCNPQLLTMFQGYRLEVINSRFLTL